MNDQNENNDRRPFFYTSEGTKYYVRTVAQEKVALATAAVEKRFREAGEPIDPPTYEAEIAGGKVEVHDHEWDVKTEEGTLETDEEWEVWNKHTAALEKMQVEQNTLSRDMWLGGIIFDVLPEWVEEHKDLGIEIPKGKKEKRIHFLHTEVLKCPDDFLQALASVQKASLKGVVSEERVDALIGTFRDTLEEISEGRWSASEGLKDIALERLDTLDKDERDSGSEGVGDDTEPVSEAPD